MKKFIVYIDHHKSKSVEAEKVSIILGTLTFSNSITCDIVAGFAPGEWKFFRIEK